VRYKAARKTLDASNRWKRNVGYSRRDRHGKVVELVEWMLDLNKQLPKAKTPHEQESLQRQIAATDKQIDTLVYELYGLTEAGIQVVEGCH
jgi:hypothetical protein